MNSGENLSLPDVSIEAAESDPAIQFHADLLEDAGLAFMTGVSYPDAVSLLLATAVSTATQAPDARLLSEAEFNALVVDLYERICDSLLVYDDVQRH